MHPRNAVPLLLLAAAAACAHGPGIEEVRAARSHFDLGNAHLHEGNPRAALEEYLQARELDPTLPDVHNVLGLVYHNTYGRHDDAIASYKKALELNPGFSEAWNNLGTVYLSLERWDEAVTCFEKALDDILYKTPWIAEVNLGWALFKKGDAARGLAHLEKSVFLEPRLCQGHRNLGLVALELEDMARAVEAFTRYAELCPTEPEAFYRLGMAQMRQGRSQEARDAFTRCRDATQGQPNHPFGAECRDTLKLLH
jgi:Tfp pilus assembly protein PilF